MLRLAQAAETSMAEVRVGDRSKVTRGYSVPGAAMMASCACLPDASNDFVKSAMQWVCGKLLKLQRPATVHGVVFDVLFLRLG
ncbi:hypothetical protein ACQ5SK_31715 [Bradyrhizobium japonicum]